MQSSNPAFRNYNPQVTGQQAPSPDYLQQMYDQPTYTGPTAPAKFLTLDDVVAKTATVLGVAIVAGFLTAYFHAYALMWPGLIVGFILSMVVIFKQSTNPALILSYSVAEGVFLGAISGLFNAQWSGIVAQAIVGTLGVFGGMLVVYKTGAIRVTPRFTKMLIGSMIGVVVLMAFNLIMSMFGMNMLRTNSGISIIFSLVCIVIASLSFLLDFDQIDKAIKQGVPAKASWYFAFGLMVTLVWLYLEILRLLGAMRSN